MKVSKTRIRSTVDGKSHTVTLKTLRQKLCQSKDLETELVRRSVVHFELWSIRSSVLNKIGQIKSVISEKPVWADKDSMDFLFPIMSWIPYIYCYPLPWGCPCCFPPRKQHLDSCRWMMSKQAPWSWFFRCSMIASHHFLTIFSGCTGGKFFRSYEKTNVLCWITKKSVMEMVYWRAVSIGCQFFSWRPLGDSSTEGMRGDGMSGKRFCEEVCTRSRSLFP